MCAYVVNGCLCVRVNVHVHVYVHVHVNAHVHVNVCPKKMLGVDAQASWC